MKPLLKIGGIQDLHDARYCSAVGIALLGFALGHPAQLGGAAISEIMAWLSGPQSVCEFGYDSPDEIRETLAGFEPDFVSIPLDYPAPLLAELPERLLFRTGSSPLSLTDLQALAPLADRFPEALFEFSLAENDQTSWSFLTESGLLQRSLLRFADADPYYRLMTRSGEQAFGFALGEFVEEADGGVDYEACDTFLEKVEELVG